MKNTKLQNVLSTATALNNLLGRNPYKIIYELLTNIPKNSMLVSWNWVKEEDGLRLTFKQDIPTTIDTVDKGFLTLDKLKDESHYKEKPKNTGSVFGTGLALINDYTTEFTFSTGGEMYNFKTDERIPFENDGVVIDMKIPFHNRMIGFVKFIQGSRDMISSVDMFMKDREHRVLVSGFKNTENVELSKPIEYDKIEWMSNTRTKKTNPDYNTLLDSDNQPISSVVLNLEVLNESRMVKLDTFQVGKLFNKPKGLNVDKDRPMMVLVCSESNQIIGKLYWKGSYPVSVNNSIIVCNVSKEDLRWLFSTCDKFEGFNPIFEDELGTLLKTNLLKYYPDSKVMEIVQQRWIHDVIVYDKIGRIPSNHFRDHFGVGFLNNLSVKIRKKLVHMEWSSGGERYDFHIFLSEDGKITSETKILLIECKRKGFTKVNMSQLVNYLVGKSKVTKVVGTSLGITTKQRNYWDKNSAKIKGSGQLSFDVEFNLVDITGENDDWGFESYVDEYQKIVIKEIEDRKSSN